MPIAKDVVKGIELHNRMKKGVDKLADAVCCTLGPGGQFVSIETPSGIPHVTKDGYTVAKSIILEDSIENMGAELVKQAAIKQNELSGDGTTTTTCLAQELYESAVIDLKMGVHPVDIKRELEILGDTASRMLEQMATPVTTSDYKNIALVSSNGDEELSELVAEAWKSSGEDGFVRAVVSKNQTTELTTSEGYLAEGYVPNPLFLTARDKGMAEYDDALVVLLGGSQELKLGPYNDILTVWQQAAPERPLVIFANVIPENVLSVLYSARMENGARVLPILTGTMGAEDFEDMGLYLGCKVFTDTEKDFKTAAQMGTLFGETSKVVYKGGRLCLTPKENHEFSDHYHDRVTMLRDLKSKIGASSSDKDQEYISKRLARMTSGVAVITVGAQTESEAKERKDRFDDAIHAVRATFSHGVLKGAGIALNTVASEINNMYSHCLRAPIDTLYANTGVTKPAHLDKPFNLRTKEFDDNIIDPAQVVINAVKDAVSVVSLLIMTNHAVVFNNDALDAFKNKVVD